MRVAAVVAVPVMVNDRSRSSAVTAEAVIRGRERRRLRYSERNDIGIGIEIQCFLLMENDSAGATTWNEGMVGMVQREPR